MGQYAGQIFLGSNCDNVSLSNSLIEYLLLVM